MAGKGSQGGVALAVCRGCEHPVRSDQLAVAFAWGGELIAAHAGSCFVAVAAALLAAQMGRARDPSALAHQRKEDEVA